MHRRLARGDRWRADRAADVDVAQLPDHAAPARRLQRWAPSPADSVVDHRGEVWGHRNLYVADGAIVPEAIGANPSRTIAALAERIAAVDHRGGPLMAASETNRPVAR